MARMQRMEETAIKPKLSEELSMLEDTYMTSEWESIQANFVTICTDQECQVDTELTNPITSNILICNRYIYNGKFSDVEIQTDIIKSTRIINPNIRKFSEKGCNTKQKTFVDEGVQF